MQFGFGRFTLDTDSRQLFRGDEPIHVSPKALELLKTLIDARPRALGKAELHKCLWPDTFVSDANLAVLVNEIRGALEDDARAPQYVRTVHGFGYAFSGTAVETRAAIDTQAPASVTHWLIWRMQKFALAEGTHLVGRSPEAAIWLDFPDISREHARLTIQGQEATIEDLDSTNGTFVEGERVNRPRVLRDGDQILFGPLAMTFRLWTPGAGTKTQDLTESTLPAS